MKYRSLLIAIAIPLYVIWLLETWITPEVIIWVDNFLIGSEGRYLVSIVIGFLLFEAVVFLFSKQSGWGYRHTFLSVGAGTIFFGALLLRIVWSDETNLPIAVVMGAVLATIGWTTIAYINLHIHDAQQAATSDLQRKQHTMDILLRLWESSIFNWHRSKILSVYPPGVDIPDGDVEQLFNKREEKDVYGPEKAPIIDSVFYIANYYEFLSAAVRSGDVDEELLKETVGSIMKDFYKKAKPLIARQTEDEKDKRTFVHYHWLVGKWSNAQ